MKKIVKVLTILFLGLSLKNVNAKLVCDDAEMNRLKELANNVQFKSEYEVIEANEKEKTLNVKYNINIVNFNSDLKITYFDNSEEIGTLKSTESLIQDLTPGSRYKFVIYAWTTNLCVDEMLKTVTVTLPKLNEYYYFNKEKCDQNPDFKYCKEFMDIDNKSFESIDEEFEEYLNPSAKDVVDDVIKGNIPWYLYVGGGVLVVGIIGTVIFIVTKKRKKDDL